MRKLLVVSLAMAALTGCPEREVTKTERVTMEVIDVDLRSKRGSTLDLKVVGTNKVYRDERFGCRRSEAEKVKIGSKWDVVVEDFRYGDRYGSELKGLQAICDKSQ
jgi:hypothetical protein